MSSDISRERKPLNARVTIKENVLNQYFNIKTLPPNVEVSAQSFKRFSFPAEVWQVVQKWKNFSRRAQSDWLNI